MISKIPAIVHVDGTARVQTVCPVYQKDLHDLLENFEKRTAGVLLNTSFTVKGQPIVETPVQAVETFKSTANRYVSFRKLLAKVGKMESMKYSLLDFNRNGFFFFKNLFSEETRCSLQKFVDWNLSLRILDFWRRAKVNN